MRVWKSMKLRLVLGLVIVLVSTSACGSSSASTARGSSLQVVVAENFWGSIAKQEAGSHASVTSIIVNPNADPHSYEPTTADARLVAGARYVILNGVGYDAWGQKLLQANPVKGRRVLVIGDLFGKKEGDNPHLWYNPSYVARVAARITSDLQALDPTDRAYFAQQHNHFMNVSLRPYHQEIALIARRYHGVKVGATESIFQYLAQALRLDLITPYSFMKAISEGTEPTAQDKVTFDRQITGREVKVFVYNSQNSTPDVNALLAKARAAHLQIATVTETLQPASVTFQAWQLSQLKALQRALAGATGH